MFDPKSDYALNKKDPDAIVYIDAAGTLTRLTLADFSGPEEFQRWKVWSDESYHQMENAGIAFSKRTLTISNITSRLAASLRVMRSLLYNPRHVNHLWNESTVKVIIRNEAYIGNMVQGKCGTVSYKSKKLVTKPKDQWIRVEGTHEPIITREV